jgi:hypothetical protein
MGMAGGLAEALAKTGGFLKGRKCNVVVVREHRSLAPATQHPCDVLRLPALTSQGQELTE